MIIGTITLITLLVTGGTYNTFVFENLDKHVNKVVVDKERKKFLKSELRVVAKKMKGYFKERKNIIKDFKTLNLDRAATRQDFMHLRDQLLPLRQEIDQYLIEDRIRLVEKLTDEEWDEIMRRSAEEAQSTKQKELEKEIKGKNTDRFAKLEQIAHTNILDESRRENVVLAISNFRDATTQLETNVLEYLPQDNAVLVRKEATVSELNTLFTSVLEVRDQTFESWIGFHFDVRENTTEGEWKKIMNEANKMIR